MLYAIRQLEDFYGTGTWERLTDTFYDPAGNVLQEQVDHPRDGTIDTVSDYAYDASGRLVWERKRWLTADSGPEVIFEHSYEYDGAGRLQRKTYWPAQWEDGRIQSFTYRSDGQRLEERWTDLAKRLQALTRWTYDEAGREVRVEHSTDGSTFEVTSRHVYDDDGRLVEIHERDFLYKELLVRHFEPACGRWVERGYEHTNQVFD